MKRKGYNATGVTFFLLFVYIFKRKEACLWQDVLNWKVVFKIDLLKILKTYFPGCMVFKMDQIQGIPDLLILYKNKWASLECKKALVLRNSQIKNTYVGLME